MVTVPVPSLAGVVKAKAGAARGSRQEPCHSPARAGMNSSVSHQPFSPVPKTKKWDQSPNNKEEAGYCVDLALSSPLKIKARVLFKSWRNLQGSWSWNKVVICHALPKFCMGDFFRATNENKSNGLRLTSGNSSSFRDQLVPDWCNKPPVCVIPRHFIPTEISCHCCQYLVCSEINSLAVHL